MKHRNLSTLSAYDCATTLADTLRTLDHLEQTPNGGIEIRFGILGTAPKYGPCVFLEWPSPTATTIHATITEMLKSYKIALIDRMNELQK